MWSFRAGLVSLLVATALIVAAPSSAAAWSHARSSSHSSYSSHSGSSKKGSGGSHSWNHPKTVSHHASHATSHPAHHASSASGVQRDSHGKIKRSQEAKRSFLKQHGLTKVPKGYEVDHRVPLCAGGSDSPSNMQLLTKAQHRAKTVGDVKSCRRR